MTSFKRYLSKHDYVVNTFFSTYLYARTSEKVQHIGNIAYVDKKKAVWDTFKTWIWTNLFGGERNWNQFFRKSNNFKYLISGRYLFFWTNFWKLTNLPNGRIFCLREKRNWYFFPEQEICVSVTVVEKKSNMICHQKMLSKKFPKTTLLHIWWLEMKKSGC